MSAKILIVEDERSLNEAYQMVLKSQGYEIYAAYDGGQALSITDEVEPDLILLDLRMPKVSGIEFLQQYQAAEKHPNVQIIIFSNLDTQSEIDEAYGLGATKYILKAWASPKELVKLVADVLKAKKTA